jgi:hypothetical protein
MDEDVQAIQRRFREIHMTAENKTMVENLRLIEDILID